MSCEEMCGSVNLMTRSRLKSSSNRRVELEKFRVMFCAFVWLGMVNCIDHLSLVWSFCQPMREKASLYTDIYDV